MIVRLLFFISIVLGTVGGAHYYIWARLVRDVGLPPAARGVATALLALIAISLPASFFLSRVLREGVARAVLLPIYVWMGAMLFILTLLAAGDLLRLALWVGRRLGEAGPIDPARRQLLARLIGGATLSVTAGVTIYAIGNALRRLVVKRLEVELRGLPRALDGTTIVQLTDLHVGPTLGREWLRAVVERVNALHPDVVAITGDLVDGRVDRLRPALEPLRQLRARRGVYFVTGNHEYYSGATRWVEALPALGVRVLRNERVVVGDGAVSFDLAGIDDFNAAGMAPGHGADLPRALAGRDASRALVLLAHQPRAVHEAARLGVGLQLSGHTHGGQLWPWSIFVRLQQPVVRGLARFGQTQIYVSDGTGFWGPPLRLGTVSEITQLTLRAPRG